MSLCDYLHDPEHVATALREGKYYCNIHCTFTYMFVAVDVRKITTSN